MMLGDQISNLRSLLARPGRLLMTLSGIVIGSAAIVLTTGLLDGGKQALLRTNQDATGSDLVVVEKRELGARERIHGRPELSRADARAVGQLQLSRGRAVAAESQRQRLAHYRGRDKRVSIVSAAPGTRDTYRLSVAQGRFLLDIDLEQRRRVCVVGQEIHAQLLQGAELGPDTAIELDGVRWQVVGVLAKKPLLGSTTGTQIWDRKLLVPATSFDLNYAGQHSADRVVIGDAPQPGPDSSVLRRSVAELISLRHAGAKNFELDDAAGRAQEQLILQVIELLLFLTGALALFVGGINVMNVMLVRVTERTREIGLRRALGATKGNILTLFLLESGALSMVGGAIGVSLGAALTALVAVGMAQVFGDFPLAVPGAGMALGAGLSLVTGVAFGLWPAWRAACLDPVAALRSE